MLNTFITVVEWKMNEIANYFKKNERGDTNFISILIILGLVILLAGVFITFKNNIVGQVEAIVNNFTINDGGNVPTP